MRKNPENPWFGDPNGHRIAALMRWGKLPKGRVKRYRKRGRPRLHGFAIAKPRRRVIHKQKRIGGKRFVIPSYSSYAIGAGRHRRRVGLASVFGAGRPGGRAFGHNPFLGGLSMRRHKRSRKRNTWFGQPRRHRKAAKKGWRRGHKIGRRRVRRYNNPGTVATMSNPRKHRRKRHANYFTNVRRKHRRSGRRHNPALGATLGKFTSGIMNVREWAPLAVTGGLSAITGAVVPGMIGVTNPWAKYGVQTAVAIGGGLAVERVAGKRHGEAWMIVGVAMVGYQLLKDFVLIPYFPQFAVGLGAYESYYPGLYTDRVSQAIDAFPQNVSAFPQNMNDYPGVGSDMGAYPYDGAGY